MKYLGEWLTLFIVVVCSSAYASGGNVHEVSIPPASQTSNNDNSKSNSLGGIRASSAHFHYIFRINGAESSGVKSESIIQINLLTDDLTKMSVTDFMQIVIEHRFDGGYAEQAIGSLFSHVPSVHNKNKTPLTPILYAVFSNKKSDGSQSMIISPSIKRLETAKDYAIPMVFKITNMQWADDPNNIILTLFLEPVPQ